MQFSTSSSLVVVLPTSPRSDLGGVIGYAMDMEGVLRSFDYEMMVPDQPIPTTGRGTTSQLLDSGLATSLPDCCSHNGGRSPTRVDQAIDLTSLQQDQDTFPAPMHESPPWLISGLATFLSESSSHTGGSITIKVDNGSYSFVDTIHPLLPLAEWKAANQLDKRDLYWQGAKLDPLMCLERRATDHLIVTLFPRRWHDGDQPVIRPFETCRESKTWSLAEISFWHPLRQPLTPLARARTSEQSTWTEDSIALDQRRWLEELLDRLSCVARMLEQWRLFQLSKKRPRALQSDWSQESSVVEDYPSPCGEANSKASTAATALPALPLAANFQGLCSWDENPRRTTWPAVAWACLCPALCHWQRCGDQIDLSVPRQEGRHSSGSGRSSFYSRPMGWTPSSPTTTRSLDQQQQTFTGQRRQ
eukprot:2073287-Amphidinium_carterae.1